MGTPIGSNTVLTYEQALSLVHEKVRLANPAPAVEAVSLEEAGGRVLGEDVHADRAYPPFHRAIRDGYALRAADVGQPPAVLECIGEVRAGEHFPGAVGRAQCVSIMTGAPLPDGADAVVMVEHSRAELASGGRAGHVNVLRSVACWENVVKQGSEAAAGAVVLRRGGRLTASELGLLAMVGRAHVTVFRRPAVAILPTGDEVVPVERQPEWFQIRNSNAVALSAQVAAAGGIPKLLPIAPDRADRLRELIADALRYDLLLLSGGVSMGKFDVVEEALAGMGAEFFFQGVAIRPGKPLVFGRLQDRFFFGLPGNTVSTFVTFELFARPAIAALGGAAPEEPVFLRARLAQPVRFKLGLRAFLPARAQLRDGDPVVALVGWQGSGDLVGLAQANCFLVIPPERSDLAAGDWVDVLPKPD